MNEQASISISVDRRAHAVPLYNAAFADQLPQLRKERGRGDAAALSCDKSRVTTVGNRVATRAHDYPIRAGFALPCRHDGSQLSVASGHIGKCKPACVDLVTKNKAFTATYEEGNNQDSRHRYLLIRSFSVHEKNRKIGKRRLWDSAQAVQKKSC